MFCILFKYNSLKYTSEDSGNITNGFLVLKLVTLDISLNFSLTAALGVHPTAPGGLIS